MIIKSALESAIELSYFQLFNLWVIYLLVYNGPLKHEKDQQIWNPHQLKSSVSVICAYLYVLFALNYLYVRSDQWLENANCVVKSLKQLTALLLNRYKHDFSQVKTQK